MSDSDSEKELRKKQKKEKKDKKKENPKRKKPVSDDESSPDEGVDDPTPIKKAKTSVTGSSGGATVTKLDGNDVFDLGKMRYASISTFHGKKYVDIREYYMDKNSGTPKPGKKGIALTQEQFSGLKGVMDDLERMLNKA